MYMVSGVLNFFSTGSVFNVVDLFSVLMKTLLLCYDEAEEFNEVELHSTFSTSNGP